MIIPVPSSDGKSFYDVRYDGEIYVCPCKGFSFRQTCKHLALADAKRKQMARTLETLMKVTLKPETVEMLDKLLAKKSPCGETVDDSEDQYHFNLTELVLLVQACVKLERG